MIAPILIFAWGNPSRGDDALGPRFVEQVDTWHLPHVECLTDFQLQVEHALDLKDRQRVLFVDATATGEKFSVTPLVAARDPTFTTHAISPQSVMQTFIDLEKCEPPPCWLLAISGHAFDLGQAMTTQAEDNLRAALDWAHRWISQ